LLLNIALVFEPTNTAGDLDIDLEGDDFFSLRREVKLKQIDTDAVIDQIPDIENPLSGDVIGDIFGTTGSPNGLRVILSPLNFVEFVTGFSVGTNLTGNTDALTVCSNTISNDFVSNGIVIYENILSLSPPQLFIAAYSMWDILYYSEYLVNSCTLLGKVMELSLI